MNTVTIGSVSRTLPSSWDELTFRQITSVASLYRKPLSVDDFRVKLLWSFLQIPRKLFRTIHPEDLYCIGKTLDFLTEEVKMSRNPMPRIGRLRGPEDDMLSCTFGEFVKAHSRLEQYTRTKEEKWLDEMTAVLYRPVKSFWFLRRRFSESTDSRVKFIDRTVATRARRISKLPWEVKYSVLLFFRGVESKFPASFPHVYMKKEDSGSGSTGWHDLVISLADGKTDDESLDRVMNSNLYNVLLGMEHKAKQYYELQQKMKHDHRRP